MRAFLFAAVLALSQQALACGYCVEDKMAAVYDHATVTRALAQKHHVAFFHIEGAVPPGAETKRAIEGLANSASGVDRGTARVSPESSSLSLALIRSARLWRRCRPRSSASSRKGSIR